MTFGRSWSRDITARRAMKRDLYAEVSTRFVAELEAGAAPWVKPWSATAGMNTPCNAVSNRPYSGCNVVLLWMAQEAGYRTPRFLTFKQALELGGNVRRGEHGTKVYFVKQLQVRSIVVATGYAASGRKRCGDAARPRRNLCCRSSSRSSLKPRTSSAT